MVTAAEARQELARRELERRRAFREQQQQQTPQPRAPQRAPIRVPMQGTIGDPLLWESVGRNVQGAVDLAKQVPSLDWGRVGRDVARTAGEDWRGFSADPVGSTVRFIAGIPQAIWHPVEDLIKSTPRERDALQRGDLQGARDALDRGVQAVPPVASLALGPAGAGGSALRAGLVGGAIAAPLALQSAPGTLQERLPRALVSTVENAGISAVLQGGANRLSAPANVTRPPSQMRARIERADRAGVRLPLAAAVAPEPEMVAGRPVNVTAEGGPAADLTRTLHENWLMGPFARRNIRNSLGDTARSTNRLARAYGPEVSPETAGEGLQGGLRRFTHGEDAGAVRPTDSVRNWSFDQRSRAIYQHVWQQIDGAIGGFRRRGQLEPITADTTRQVLEDIFAHNSERVGALVNDQVLHDFHDLMQSGEPLRFNDLRSLRTYVRELQARDPAMRPGLGDANLERLEGALTTDQLHSAQLIGGPRMARSLALADRYYRVGNERVRALAPLLRASSGRKVYDALTRMAQDGGSQNTNVLLAARRSVQPHEWQQLAATYLDEMGKAPKGHPYAAEGAFSVESLATRLNALSREGRRAIFGDLGSPTGRPAGGNFIDLERALDDLARTAGLQKGIERTANFSRSGTRVQNIGTLGLVASGAANPTALLGAAALIPAGMITGDLLTRPYFVRWLASARRGGGVGGIRRQIATLGRLAASDPALLPLYEQLSRAEAGSGRDPASRQRPLEAASR